MIDTLKNRGILILGGGGLCEKLIASLDSVVFKNSSPKIFGIVDADNTAPGVIIGRKKSFNIYGKLDEDILSNGIDLVLITVSDFKKKELVLLKNIGSNFDFKILDYLSVVLLLDLIKFREIETRIVISFEEKLKKREKKIKSFDSFFDKIFEFSEVFLKKNKSYKNSKLKNDKLAQIVKKFTIPTFVIDKNHMITHWNYAIEKMTGYSAFEMIGTKNQWIPFFSKLNCTMADLVLDQYSNNNFHNFYGENWKRSKLITEGYESEKFFSKFGKDTNKWLFFTVALVRSFDREVIGVIQTIWDITENKKIENERRRYILQLEDKKKALDQIIQGSTIPTFIINSQHLISHWNCALEKMTGYLSHNMLGTNNQWLPFWQEPRSTMADAVLDKTGKHGLETLYGGKWRKSDLIEGAYEAELFFPKMGNKGKWLFFTATPIKSANGTVIGAIETLWDTTESRRAEVQRKRYTGRLEEKERELAQIIQGSTVPTFVINKDHMVTHWNHALEKLTGFRAIDMLGTSNHWKPFVNRKQPTMADLILDKFLKGKMDSRDTSKWRKSSLVEGGYESEEFFSKLGSEGTWLFFTAAPIKTSYNSINAVIQTFWDVSLAKRAENERHRYTNELATLCSMYTVLNSPISLNTRIQNTIKEIRNFVKADYLGIHMSNNREELTLHYSSYCMDIEEVFFDKLTNDKEIIKQVSRIKKPVVIEYELQDKGGYSEKVYIPIVAKYQKDFGVMQIIKKCGSFSSDDMHLLDLVGNRIGITVENSRLREELERKSEFQSKLIKSANDGIIATDSRWKMVIFNPAAEKIFAYRLKDFSDNKDIRDFFPRKALDVLHNSAFLFTNEDSSSWFEMEIVTKTGILVPVRFSGSVLREKNEMIGTVAFFQDLREIKYLEKELVQSEKLAAVGQTVAGMAHCIKNILHGFKGGRYLMDVGTNKNNLDKIKNGWAMIQRNINRTSDLVMDLLSYSKEREPEIEFCNPNEIIDDVCQLLEGLAVNNGIKLIKIYSDNTSLFKLDPKIIHRCLMNLVTNAIDACIFDDKIEVLHSVILKTYINSEGFIVFGVKDNGCGMTEEVKLKLFSSFFSTKGTKGTGLGLLVTAKLLEEHSGSIKVISEESKGTVFKIQITSNLSLGVKGLGNIS